MRGLPFCLGWGSFLFKDLAKNGGAWKHFFWASVEGQSLPGASSAYGGWRSASIHSAAGKELWWVSECPSLCQWLSQQLG